MLELKDLVVDEEMHKRLRRLSADEMAGLRADIKARGCIKPIVVWKHHCLVLDGRHRLEICLEEGIDAEIKEESFDSKEDAQAWMYRHQVDQRNLDPKSISEIRGWLAKHEEDSLEVVCEQELSIVPQTAEQLPSGKKRSSGRRPSKRRAANKKVAAATKTSEDTIARDREYSEAMERIEQVNAKAASDIRDGSIKISKADIIKISKGDIPTGLKNLRQGLPWNAGVSAPATKKKKPVSVAAVVDELRKKYVGPLARGLTAVAKINGGEGEQFEIAHSSLNNVELALQAMRKGLR